MTFTPLTEHAPFLIAFAKGYAEFEEVKDDDKKDKKKDKDKK